MYFRACAEKMRTVKLVAIISTLGILLPDYPPYKKEKQM
jgi:hypothetical protein